MVRRYALPAAVAVIFCVGAIIVRGEDSPPSPQSSDALTLDLGRKVKITLVRIPAGKFIMGCPKDEKGRLPGDFDKHEVTITRPFYLGVYPGRTHQ